VGGLVSLDVRGRTAYAGSIVVVGAVWLTTLVLANSASAAFPGRNGLLAVTPVSGPGLALVNPQTGAAKLVCTNTLLCGAPSHAQWSPNGRALIVVDTNTSRPEVLASDGTCLWCLLGRQLSNQLVNTPAFASSGSAITFGVGGSRSKAGLWQLSLSGSRARRISTARVSDAVWSAPGEVALVRGGYVETGRDPSGRLRKVARGASPSWAPNGTRLALVRGGWIWIVPIKGGAARRLARGSSPAWSPDGQRLAYIGPGHAVEVIAVGGGHPRRLAGATGLSVDWQPLPRSSGPSCTRPGGSSVMAETPEALVTAQTTQNGTGQKVIGCLRALGKRQVLYSGMSAVGCYAGTSVTHAVLAGRYAALQFFSCDHYGACGNMASIVDLSRSASTELATQDCSASGLEGFDGLSADSSGFVAWLEVNAVTPYRQLAAISCPTVSLCAADDVDGDVVSTTTPTGAATAWSVENVYNQPLSSMSCANASFCLAGGSTGVVFASSNPVAGWNRYQVDPDGATIQAVSCPSTGLCVGGDNDGNVLVSTNPLGGASTWTVTKVTPTTPFFPDGVAGIDCPSVSLCVAADAEGNVLTSTDPTGGATSWQLANLGSNSALPGPSSSGVACPSTQQCVVAEPAGILSSTNPMGGTSAWSLAKFGTSSFTGVSCPLTTFCAAIDEEGNVWTTANPAGGATAWQPTNLGPGLTGISCPSASLCVAVNQRGSVLSSTDPSANAASAWASAPVDALPCLNLTACDSTELLAHDDRGTRVVDSTKPGSGTSITNIALAGDSLVLQWADGAGAMQLGLR
jgi:hypothetical protein